MSFDRPTGGDSFPDRNSEGGDRPFPGAPENREPVEEPTNSRSLDDIRAAHERAGSLEEFDAIEKATRPSGYEIPAPGPGGRETFSGWTEGARYAGVAETGERGGDDQAGPGSRTSADSSQQAQRGEETGREKEAEGQDGEPQEVEPEDWSRDQARTPDANPAVPDATGPEDSPDAHPDDQRPLTVAAAKALIADVLAETNAKHEARIEELQAEHKAETEKLKIRYEAKIGDLAARLEAVEAGRRTRPGDSDRGDAESEAGTRDAADPGRRGDRLVVGESEDASTVLSDANDIDDIDEMLVPGPDREAPRVSDRSILSPEDADLAKSAAGVLESLGVSVPGMDLLTGGDSTRQAIEKMSPEGQLRAMRMAENFGILSSSMPPETAAVAFAASLLGPGLYAKSRDRVRDFVQKNRSKE